MEELKKSSFHQLLPSHAGWTPMPLGPQAVAPPPSSCVQPGTEKKPKRPGTATRGRAAREAWREVRFSGGGGASAAAQWEGRLLEAEREGGGEEEQEGWGQRRRVVQQEPREGRAATG